MSAIKLSTPSSGSISLSPADTASNLTITVPAVSGTMLTNKTAGTVLQVVQGNFSSTTSTTSTTYVDTGLSASITPSSTSSKVLVIVDASISQITSGNSAAFVIDRNGTKPQTPNFVQSAPVVDGSPLSFSYLDSPSSTSSLTYKVQMRNQASVYTTIFGNESGAEYTYNTITLMEIAG